MNEAGLPQKWRRRFFNAKSDQCIGNNNLVVNKANNKNHRISLKNMSGSFVVLLVGIATSFVIFIVELILLRKEKRNQPKVVDKLRIIVVKPAVNSVKAINNPPAPLSDNGVKIQVPNQPLQVITAKRAPPAPPAAAENAKKIIRLNRRPPIADKIKTEKVKPEPTAADKGKAVIKVVGSASSPGKKGLKMNVEGETKKEVNVVIVQAKIEEQQKEKQQQTNVEHPAVNITNPKK